jgi:hypothetical protein
MAYQLHSEYVDEGSGFHVIVLRDGRKEHILQIAIGYDSCPACGAVYPKTNLNEIDPKAAAATAVSGLNKSQNDRLLYAKKHNLTVR